MKCEKSRKFEEIKLLDLKDYNYVSELKFDTWKSKMLRSNYQKSTKECQSFFPELVRIFSQNISRLLQDSAWSQFKAILPILMKQALLKFAWFSVLFYYRIEKLFLFITLSLSSLSMTSLIQFVLWNKASGSKGHLINILLKKSHEILESAQICTFLGARWNGDDEVKLSFSFNWQWRIF